MTTDPSAVLTSDLCRSDLCPPPPHAPATALLPKPPWIDGDILFRTLSPDHQRAVVALLQPLYDQLVLQPHDPFEQLTGNGLVYLLWDELLRQCQIGSMQNVPFADQTDRSRHMAELLRIFDTKCKLSTILLRLRAIQS